MNQYMVMLQSFEFPNETQVFDSKTRAQKWAESQKERSAIVKISCWIMGDAENVCFGWIREPITGIWRNN